MQRIPLMISALLVALTAAARDTYNFNGGWLLTLGDVPQAQATALDDSGWQPVTLPRAFNGDEAFGRSIEQLTDTVCWYRKHFRLPPGTPRDARVYLEMEGIRQAGDFYLNGHYLGLHENGVTASGWDLTPYIDRHGDNLLAIRIDNDWDYRERATGEKFQWNDRNFNANYGGIPKNVYLHITPAVHQTLPLYSNLGTTGTYIYATDHDVAGRRATVNVETQAVNTTGRGADLRCRVALRAPRGNAVASFDGTAVHVAAGDTVTLTASAPVEGLEFWSWGYGWLYDVDTQLIDAKGRMVDSVTTRTGFRKTRFGGGLVWLNDRVVQVHGYAQRTSNEWPALGMSVPAWLSDLGNGSMVESGGNLVRWMHVAPWRQDVESCDRVGLMQAMPAGDAEKDVEGRRWQHRLEVMRDAMIYYRNNPSILFYEAGNKGISPAHMSQMLALRDLYDPHGGRAMGCREMLDVPQAEYGGEMLYINRSAAHPVWAMEYCRDEGLRKYWDAYSYPWHPEGEGPLYRGKDASEYNRNQDQLALEMVRRWHDYWLERPGAGDRCSSGGVKIIFSDTNTHYRGRENYRRSGVTDAMRIPKDAYWAHRVMWGDTWVDNNVHRAHIIGHWNYADSTVKPVYVVSTAPVVELWLNGRCLGRGERSHHFLHTFPDVMWEAGELEAVGLDGEGRQLCTASLATAGQPARLVLTTWQNPLGFQADGADVALVQVEVVDSGGRRCPLDNRTVAFSLDGPAQWLGGIAQGPGNCILSAALPVECGVNRVLVRSTNRPGTVRLTATAGGLPPASVEFTTVACPCPGGLSGYLPAMQLEGDLHLGPTPQGASYTPRMRSLPVASVRAGSNNGDGCLSLDDNEASQWSSAGPLENAWITYALASPARVDDICLKMGGWRSRSYPLEVLADGAPVWSGDTPKGLGYIHIRPENMPVANEITLRLKGAASDRDAFAITELAGGQANALEKAPAAKGRLTIVEAEMLQKID